MENKNSAMGNVMLVLVTLVGIFLVGFLIFGTDGPVLPSPVFGQAHPGSGLKMLKDGNERFSAGKSAYLHCDPTRSAWRAYRTKGICLRHRCFLLRLPGPGGADLRRPASWTSSWSAWRATSATRMKSAPSSTGSPT